MEQREGGLEMSHHGMELLLAPDYNYILHPQIT